jgi:hypothetical protein
LRSAEGLPAIAVAGADKRFAKANGKRGATNAIRGFGQGPKIAFNPSKKVFFFASFFYSQKVNCFS